MEFFNSFIPVFMKCDFSSEFNAKDWIECHVNVKPNVMNRCIRITIHPKCYDEMIPNIILNVDSIKMNGGPVKSRSKLNVFGLLWNDEQNKKCRMFITFDNKRMHQNFSKYFKELLKLFGDNSTNTEIECKVNAPMCNEGEQTTLNASCQANTVSSIQIMRESNASASCEDIVLRPKPAVQCHRLARSVTAISGLFKSIRESGTNHKKKDENAQNVSPPLSLCDTKRTKCKTWKMFKSKEKQPPSFDALPSFQRFQEPLNIERLSLARGDIDVQSIAEWYDLNKDEMSLCETRASNIVSEFNSYIYNHNQISSSSNGESLNALWPHNNLSTFCQLGSSVQYPCMAIQSIPPNKSVEPINLIDDFMTKTVESKCNCNFDESCKLSSGFGSGFDINSTRKSTEYTDSPTNFGDFSETVFPFDQSNVSSECLPSIIAAATTNTTATTAPLPPIKNMQKSSKKHRIQINSRKLFGILRGKHTPSLVDVTPQNKSPTECQGKKLRHGTPFKLRTMKPKQTHAIDLLDGQQ